MPVRSSCTTRAVTARLSAQSLALPAPSTAWTRNLHDRPRRVQRTAGISAVSASDRQVQPAQLRWTRNDRSAAFRLSVAVQLSRTAAARFVRCDSSALGAATSTDGAAVIVGGVLSATGLPGQGLSPPSIIVGLLPDPVLAVQYS